MLGLIIIAPEEGPGLSPHALLEEMLGAPLLARAIAGALPTSEAVAGVLVVPAELVDEVRSSVVDRFALDEIDAVVAGGPSRHDAIVAGLAALADDVEWVMIHEASFVLPPVGLADRVVRAARDGDCAAVPGRAVSAQVAVVNDDKLQKPAKKNLQVLQSPVVVRRERLQKALEEVAVDMPDASTALWLCSQGDEVAIADGDDDNMLLVAPADISRAVEVFSRRAVDYAFIYPKDMLPDDPLAKALAAAEGE